MNTLQHKQEFKKILQNYTIDDRTYNMLLAVNLVVFSGITSSGKNTIIDCLVETGSYHRLISDTTRSPRPGESNGLEYWFKAEDEVLEGVREGLYLEAALIHDQQVSGTHIDELIRAHNQGKIAINEVDIKGVETLVALKPSITNIFVIPPSIETWQVRMSDRGKMTDEELRRRIASAKNELTVAINSPYYHFLINDDLDRAVSDSESIIRGQIDGGHEVAGRELATRLLADISKL